MSGSLIWSVRPSDRAGFNNYVGTWNSMKQELPIYQNYQLVARNTVTSLQVPGRTHTFAEELIYPLLQILENYLSCNSKQRPPPSFHPHTLPLSCVVKILGGAEVEFVCPIDDLDTSWHHLMDRKTPFTNWLLVCTKRWRLHQWTLFYNSPMSSNLSNLQLIDCRSLIWVVVDVSFNCW